jgi:hypothetical protein
MSPLFVKKDPYNLIVLLDVSGVCQQRFLLILAATYPNLTSSVADTKIFFFPGPALTLFLDADLYIFSDPDMDPACIQMAY